MQRLRDVLGVATERIVDRATNAGHPPPADVVAKLKSKGLLKADNEIPQVTREMLDEEE